MHAATISQQAAQKIPPGRASIAESTTTDLLVDTIARQVAERVGRDILEHLQASTRIQPVLLSVKDAAVYLGRSEQSIQHLIFDRELPVVRVGRRVHLDRRDLDAWIEKNKY